jgi:hypothetical protein
VPRLTELAFQIAAGCTDPEKLFAWVHMIEILVLNRFLIDSARPGIY